MFGHGQRGLTPPVTGLRWQALAGLKQQQQEREKRHQQRDQSKLLQEQGPTHQLTPLEHQHQIQIRQQQQQLAQLQQQQQQQQQEAADAEAQKKALMEQLYAQHVQSSQHDRQPKVTQPPGDEDADAERARLQTATLVGGLVEPRLWASAQIATQSPSKIAVSKAVLVKAAVSAHNQMDVNVAALYLQAIHEIVRVDVEAALKEQANQATATLRPTKRPRVEGTVDSVAGSGQQQSQYSLVSQDLAVAQAHLMNTAQNDALSVARLQAEQSLARYNSTIRR